MTCPGYQSLPLTVSDYPLPSTAHTHTTGHGCRFSTADSGDSRFFTESARLNNSLYHKNFMSTLPDSLSDSFSLSLSFSLCPPDTSHQYALANGAVMFPAGGAIPAFSPFDYYPAELQLYATPVSALSSAAVAAAAAFPPSSGVPVTSSSNGPSNIHAVVPSVSPVSSNGTASTHQPLYPTGTAALFYQPASSPFAFITAGHPAAQAPLAHHHAHQAVAAAAVQQQQQQHLNGTSNGSSGSPVGSGTAYGNSVVANATSNSNAGGSVANAGHHNHHTGPGHHHNSSHHSAAAVMASATSNPAGGNSSNGGATSHHHHPQHPHHQQQSAHHSVVAAHQAAAAAAGIPIASINNQLAPAWAPYIMPPVMVNSHMSHAS